MEANELKDALSNLKVELEGKSKEQAQAMINDFEAKHKDEVKALFDGELKAVKDELKAVQDHTDKLDIKLQAKDIELNFIIFCF